jgi:hypothetical protein
MTVSISILVVGAVLLICLGMLLGTSWTVNFQHRKFRQQADERRRFNEEWSVVYAARRKRDECPRCAAPLSEETGYCSGCRRQNGP